MIRRLWAGVFVLLLPIAMDEVRAGAPKPADDRELPTSRVEHQGHTYLVVDNVEELSWTKGRDRCAAWGGYLTVVNDEAEAKFISTLCDGRYLFLGASDAATEGSWAWVDGTPWEFTNWMAGQPNDYTGSEDYLATYDGGKWVDVDHAGEDFWMPTGFICEWSKPATTSATEDRP